MLKNASIINLRYLIKTPGYITRLFLELIFYI